MIRVSSCKKKNQSKIKEKKQIHSGEGAGERSAQLLAVINTDSRACLSLAYQPVGGSEYLSAIRWAFGLLPLPLLLLRLVASFLRR